MLNIFQIIILFFVLVESSLTFEDDKYLPVNNYSVMRSNEIIEYFGYPSETHKVQTEDGYILTNFRIPNPGGHPVLFFHGLTGTSDCWFMRNPKYDLVYLLWRRGYDIWLWNARGNCYSNEHVNMTVEEERFYLFSYHELGLQDTVATVDYILNITGFDSVVTVGHSLGTVNSFISGTMRPEYQNKIKLNILYAQAVLLKKLLIKDLADVQYSLYKRWFNVNKTQIVNEKGTLLDTLKQKACRPYTFWGELCAYGFAQLSGLGTNQAPKSSIWKMISKLPSQSSFNTLKQMVQNTRTGKFMPLSYGPKENIKRYGTKYPKPYPLHKYKTPTAIYLSCCNDYLSAAADARHLRDILPNVVKFYIVPYNKFNHGDFLWAKDSYKLIYKDTLDLINEYSPYMENKMMQNNES